jgi:hypothetical protein
MRDSLALQSPMADSIHLAGKSRLQVVRMHPSLRGSAKARTEAPQLRLSSRWNSPSRLSVRALRISCFMSTSFISHSRHALFVLYPWNCRLNAQAINWRYAFSPFPL